MLGITGSIIMLGVSKASKPLRATDAAPLHPVLVLCVRSLTEERVAGTDLPVQPGLSKITPAVILTALGLAFFKLSLGMGTMLTYGSYFRGDQDIPLTTTRVMLADLSGFSTRRHRHLPAVFAFGFEPTAGPSLVFMTILAVFAAMPGGVVFMTIFIPSAAIASVGAILSLLEVPVAILSGRRFGMGPQSRFGLHDLGDCADRRPAALSQGVLPRTQAVRHDPFDLFDFLVLERACCRSAAS